MDEPIVASAAEVAAPAAAPVAPAPVVAPAPAEVKPEVAAIEERPEVAAVPSAEPIPLAIPEYLPLSERTEQREGYVAEFAQVAAETGIESKFPGLSQALLDQVAEVATGIGKYEAADQHTTPEDTCSQMSQMFGRDVAEKIVADAQQTVRAMGPQVAAYLDRTGLGNDVAVLVALSQGGYLTRSREAAQKELDATMNTKEYLRGDKLLVMKVAALSRIANREDAPTAAPAKPQRVQVGIGRVVTSDQQQAELRAEAAQIASSKQMTREQANRFMEITAKLAGGA